MADGTTNIGDDGATYAYKPLPDATTIRLLRRLNRGKDGPLRFSLQTYSLYNRSPGYLCLSYTWGNPFAHGRVFEPHYQEMNQAYTAPGAATIIVNGRPMRVSKNLHDALTTVPKSAVRDYTNRYADQTLMHAFASKGWYVELRNYARRGVDLGAVDKRGRTPLHLAAANGHKECVGILCGLGARRNVRDRGGNSPKELAADGGHQSVVDLLEVWEARPEPVASSLSRDEEEPEKLIWVDAICINQNDVEEKSAQVSMMDVIYSRATVVIAWLGPEDHHTAAGYRAHSTLTRYTNQFRESRIEPFNGTDEPNYTEARMPLITPEEWEGLASIYQRQWFRRSWIVQEAVLPKEVAAYCGPHLFDIQDLGSVAEEIRAAHARTGTSGGKDYAPLDSIAVSVEWNMAEVFKWRENRSRASKERREGKTSSEAFRMGLLARDFRSFLSSDPRDKIFSLLGLVYKFSEQRGKADYRMSVAKVYETATRQIIREDGDLRVLCERNDVRPVEGLPSWVPDFSVPGVISIPNSAADRGIAVPGFKNVELDSPVLKIRGLRVGPINEVAGRVSTAPGGKLMFEPGWLRLALSLRDKQDPDAEKPILTEILWRTLCMNTTFGAFFDSDNFEKEAPEEMGRQFIIFMASMILAGADQKMLESVGLEADQERDMHTEIHNPACDPWEGELAETLRHLDKLAEHDAERCFTPTRPEVMWSWGDIKYTLMRTSDVMDTGRGYDFSVSSRVADGTDRLVGRGVVNLDSPVYRKCRDFGAAFQAAYSGRQVVAVDGRYLGLAPVAARGGDEVWVVPGLRAPAVLRRVGGDLVGGELSLEAPRYEFVGISYVHGIMNGEAIRGAQCDLQDIGLV